MRWLVLKNRYGHEETLDLMTCPADKAETVRSLEPVLFRGRPYRFARWLNHNDETALYIEHQAWMDTHPLMGKLG